MLFASTSLPAKDLRGLAAQAQELKGKLNYGSPGLGTTPQMALELLNRSLGLGMTHVAYRGSPQVLQALVAGEIQLGYGLPSAGLPFVQQGRLRVVGVTGDKRMASIPETPTFKELGLDHIGGVTWWALVAPAGTPEPILDKVNAAMRMAFAAPEVRKRLDDMGFIPVAGTRKEMSDLIAREASHWARTIKELALEKQ
jgi:tripartite-type tricarboxylate transporter receptor subunit TctC